MRLTLQSIRTLPTSLKDWLVQQFSEPPSPYESVNESFREQLKEHGTEEQKKRLANWLEVRFGFRKGSLSNTLLVLSVVLTSIFVLHDTIADTLISVDKWARPLFLPALWCVVVALYFLAKAAKADKKEVNDLNPNYSGDEAEQRFKVEYGDDITVENSALPGAAQPDVANADLTEVASRAAHDRHALWLKRYYMNKSLNAAFVAVVCSCGALTIYAIVGLFV